MAKEQARNDRYKVAEVIAALKDTRGIQTIVAQKLGCDRDTVRRYIDRYPTVREAYDREREGIVDSAEVGLVAALARQEWRAIVYTLNTLGRKRGYGRPLDEPGGNEDNPLYVSIIELAKAAGNRQYQSDFDEVDDIDDVQELQALPARTTEEE